MPDNKQPSAVTTSAVMMAPSLEKIASSREYPRLPEPVVGHARLESRGVNAAALVYNGIDLLTLRLDSDTQPMLRFHSDGDFQSGPFIQQFLIASPRPVKLTVEARCPIEMINMRPRRAQAGEAILGQIGRPLMAGINGLYIPLWDLLVSWHGSEFKWNNPLIANDETGFAAAFSLMLDRKPLTVLFRPRYYAEHLGYQYHRPSRRAPNPKPFTGWCSWEAYHSKVTQADVTSAAKALAQLKPYGLEYMQIDDGYQTTKIPPALNRPIGDSWLLTNEKFPQGHDGIVGAIRSAGFTPGIWTAAMINNEEAAYNAGYTIKKADGSPLMGDWIHYIIDCLPESLEREIIPYYKALKEKGYGYVKSDALRHLLYDGLQEAARYGLITSDEAHARFRAYLEAIRAGLFDDVYHLSCWGVLSEAIGISDAMRIATDTSPRFCSYSMQIRETARWYFAQRIMFTCDPDVVCVRGPLEWARTAISLTSLSGGLLMISDKPETYDEDRLNLIRRSIPALPTRAAETGPIDYTTPASWYAPEDCDLTGMSRDIGYYHEDEPSPLGSLWAFHYQIPGRAWCVVQRAAPAPLPEYVASWRDLALEEGRAYIAFDFWNQRQVPVTRDGLPLPALSLGETVVIGITDVTDGSPSLIASDRHVSMDAVSVISCEHNEKRLTVELMGFAGLIAVYWFYNAKAVSVQGGSASSKNVYELLRVEVRFDKTRACLTVE